MKYALPALLALACVLTACRSLPRPSVVTPVNITEARLHDIIIPEVEFRAANLSDCLDFVQTHIDRRSSEDGGCAPRFVCDLATARYLLVREPKADGHLHPPLPTFRAKDISVLEVIKILGEVCEVQFAYTSSLIVVTRNQEGTANK